MYQGIYYQGIYYDHEGFEFIFSSKAVYSLVNMIKNHISHQGKDPEKIHICIVFWLSDFHRIRYDEISM